MTLHYYIFKRVVRKLKRVGECVTPAEEKV